MAMVSLTPIALSVLYIMTVISGCWSLPATNDRSTVVNRNTTELFAYPAEQSTIEAKQNARNRTPIYIPRRCAMNEILYPGDHENDWVCDCKPTYVYHAETQQCYQMHTVAFCKPNQLMYLEPGGKIPVCVDNECPKGLVPFKNECVKLNEPHDLCHLAGIKLVVGINETTHKLECVNISDVVLNHTMISAHNSRLNAGSN